MTEDAAITKGDTVRVTTDGSDALYRVLAAFERNGQTVLTLTADLAEKP